MLTARFYPPGPAGPRPFPFYSPPTPPRPSPDSVAVQPTNDDAAATPLAATHGIKDHEIRVSSFAMHYMFGKKLAPGPSRRSVALASSLFLLISLFAAFLLTRVCFECEREREREKRGWKAPINLFRSFFACSRHLRWRFSRIDILLLETRPLFRAHCRYNEEKDVECLASL